MAGRAIGGAATALALAALALATGCGKKDDAAGRPAGGAGQAAGAAAGGPPAKGTGRVRVAVSVDWEGAYLTEDGLDGLDGFRERNPDVPLTHFISAAYFTKPGVDREKAAATIGEAIGPRDEVALHVHAWRSLVEAAGVPYRATPSFLAAELMAFPDGDQGFEVELAAYTAAELRTLIATSRRLLEDGGLKVAPHFRSSGWMGTPVVLEAVRAEGFTTDSSSTDPSWLDGALAGAALPGRLREIWPKVDRTTQPFVVETPAGELLELPMSAAMADYLEPAEMVEHLRWALAELDRQPDRDVFVHLGFHQETASEFAPRVEKALAEVRPAFGQQLVFETVGQTAAAARVQLGREAR
jgi:hypothetical protein